MERTASCNAVGAVARCLRRRQDYLDLHGKAKGEAIWSDGLRSQGYLPKGVDVSEISQIKLNAIARQLNDRPRKTLGFQTPAEMFGQCVAMTG